MQLVSVSLYDLQSRMAASPTDWIQYPDAYHLSVQERAPELRKREAGLHQLDDASETSGEPGGSASGDFPRLVLGTFFSLGVG